MPPKSTELVALKDAVGGGGPDIDDTINNNNNDDDGDGDVEKLDNVLRPQSAMANASFYSRLLFLWPGKLLKLGMERPLEETDLPDCLEQDTSSYNRNYFENLWREEQKRNPLKPNLRWAILKDFLKTTWYIQPMMMCAAIARVVQAVAVGKLVQSFEDDQTIDGSSVGYFWASILVVCGMVVLFEHHHMFLHTWRKGMQIGISCVAAIHDKALRLPSTSQETLANCGYVLNLAGNDVEKFHWCAGFFSYLFWAPLQGLGVFIVGLISIGPAFAAGFVMFLLFFVPILAIVGLKFAELRSAISKFTDQRVTFVSQAIRGARVMKMSGYEWRFKARIDELRREELKVIRKTFWLRSMVEGIFFGCNALLALFIFLVHVYTGGTLSPGDVATAFTLINIIQIQVARYIAVGVHNAVECFVSVGRIQEFLQFPEQPTQQVKSLTSKSFDDSDETVISMSNVTCYWNNVDGAKLLAEKSLVDKSAGSAPAALQGVTVDFRRGELTAIVGAVGAGKSALLQAICQELPVATGTMSVRYESMAYAAQDPWLMDGTIKENITMGHRLREDWYQQVIKACGLVLDFRQLRDGDQTVVGDQGVQCSGGQRARIGLARAIYRDADVLVADDPLSAVDAKVGRQIFQEAIMGLGVMRNKCVILATHQHQYISESRCILVSMGRVNCIGSYEECIVASKGNLTSHMGDDSVDNLVEEACAPNATTGDAADSAAGVVKKSTGDDHDEGSGQGAIGASTYLSYINAMGGIWVAVGLLVLCVVTQASVLIPITTVAQWAKKEDRDQQFWDLLIMVIGMGSMIVILSVGRCFISFFLMVKASERMHDRATEALLRAPIEFFDTNPLGRILNRFSIDVGCVDDILPQTMAEAVVLSFIVIGGIAACIATLPFTIIVIPPVLIYYLKIQRTFITSGRELQRMDSVALSPIFSMLGEALSGIATIRTNNCQEFFKNKFDSIHDARTRAFFPYVAAERWVGFRLDTVVFILLVLVSYASVYVHQQGWFVVDSAKIGLSISMLMYLAGLFQFCVLQSAKVANKMVSVERILEYAGLESEAALDKPGDLACINKGWPNGGAIEFDNLSVRYRRTLPLALENVSFKIPAGSHVGIVGRTGSGKSTIVQTLFRLLEPESGRMIIDGVNVSELGLHVLRPRLSVIPQVPTLFSGCTVRENLDLFGLQSDEDLRKVLDACHMGDVIDALPDGWNSMVAEGGSNFSVGQRQLLCLARAILAKNRILILDEATASVDRRTDQLLQQTLQETYQDGTILAVAHRLDTVIESDYILVLGKGHVQEFGSPADLLRKQNGAFASMVQDTGENMSRDLRQRAFQKEADNKNGKSATFRATPQSAPAAFPDAEAEIDANYSDDSNVTPPLMEAGETLVSGIADRYSPTISSRRRSRKKH